MMRLLARRATAVLAGGALLAAASVYPAPALLLAALLLPYMALLLWRPALWLLLVPALLPVLDVAPWTGWFFLDELDLLLLATACAGYWAVGRERAPTRLPRLTGVALTLFLICYLVAAWRGVWPLTPLDANAFANYNSPYNGLRVLKGVLWPLLLLPLLRATAGEAGANLQRYLVPGMLLGLAGCSLAVVWERLAFPGLFNFSSDYRPTAPFSAMHTGGAALDAYLAMAFPFVTLWLAGHPPPRRLALGLGALALGLFAGLTIFSRDIYLAYAAAGAVILTLGAGHHWRRGALAGRTVAATVLLLGLAFWVLSQVFGQGGYRGLAAALGLLGTAVLLAGAATRLAQPLVAAGLAAALLAAVGVLGSVFDKGAYLGYGLTVLGTLGGAALLWLPERRAQGVLLLAATLPAQALAAVLVSHHYGGAPAVPGGMLAVVLALALATTRLLPRPPFHLERGSLMVAGFAGIVMAALIPVASSYYTGSRFATVGDDLTVRLNHWRDALEMMDGDGLTQAFGQGLGRYPATYLWRNTRGEVPGTFRYVDEGNNRFVRLGAAQLGQSYGEVLRLLQHVAMQPGRRYRLQMDVRRSQADAWPAANVCQRWLLYSEACSPARFAAQPLKPGWQTVSAELAPRPARTPWGAPLQLEIWNGSIHAALDIDNVRLTEIDSGRELVANGSFSTAPDFWFFSSDRNHMPWHVKNFAVNQVFELGWAGALATAFLVLAVAAPLLGRGLGGELYASVSLAALTGVMMVGLFDSLTDVPRLSILMLLIALAGCLQPARRRIRVRRDAQESNDALMA